MRILPATFAACLLFLAIPVRTEDGIRFAEVQFRILTSGAKQLPQEAGTFHASLPLGTAGHLQREVTITNATRAVSRKVLLNIGLTPVGAEDGTLHCMVLTDALPEGGEPVSRAKDMVFHHPGEQLMELFADPRTGTHLILSVQVTLSEEEERPPDAVRWPRLRFAVKVERWEGADRTLLEQAQLISEDGLPVSHRYDRRVPRWVESEKASAPDFLAQLPVIDPEAGKTTIGADQGFSIMLPTAPKKAPPPEGDPPAKGPADPPPPPLAPAAGSKPSGRSLIWVQEWLELWVTPVEMKGGVLSFKISASGDILDPDRNRPDSLGRTEMLKSARPSEPAPLYLTREEATGPSGYVIWVVPEW